MSHKWKQSSTFSICQISQKAQGCPYEMIEDRGEAIRTAMEQAKGKTLFLVTGKGAETRQKYGSEYVDCPSDVEYVKKYLHEYDQRAE